MVGHQAVLLYLHFWLLVEEQRLGRVRLVSVREGRDVIVLSPLRSDLKVSKTVV